MTIKLLIMKSNFLKKILVLFCLFCLSCENDEPINLLIVNDEFSSIITTDSNSFIDGNSRFSSSATLDITNNEVIADNQNFIIDSRVNTLTYEIRNFSGNPQTINNAAIVIGGTRINIGNIEILSSLNTENFIRDRFLLNKIAHDLRNTVNINTLFTGELNDNAVSFDVIIKTNLSIGIDDLQ